AARTFWTAGRSRPMSTARMAITTSSSISVKPERTDGRRMATSPFQEQGDRTQGERGKADSAAYPPGITRHPLAGQEPDSVSKLWSLNLDSGSILAAETELSTEKPRKSVRLAE